MDLICIITKNNNKIYTRFYEWIYDLNPHTGNYEYSIKTLTYKLTFKNIKNIKYLDVYYSPEQFFEIDTNTNENDKYE